MGFDKKLKKVDHHTLFFDVDFDVHAEAIYDNPAWPEKPFFMQVFLVLQMILVHQKTKKLVFS